MKTNSARAVTGAALLTLVLAACSSGQPAAGTSTPTGKATSPAASPAAGTPGSPAPAAPATQPASPVAKTAPPSPSPAVKAAPATAAPATKATGSLAASPSPARATSTPHVSGGVAGAAGLIIPPGLPRYEVLTVETGDTVILTIDGQPVRIVPIGFVAPKPAQGGQPAECFAEPSREKAKSLALGKRVWIQDDPTQGDRDSFGRLIRHIWLPDGSLFQLEMINEGFGWEYSENNQYALRSLFRSTQQNAQRAEKGLWASNTCRGRPETAYTPGPGDPGY